jgi:hypothetical protein
MLTGQRLFPGESAVEILGGVLNKEPDISAAPKRVHKLLRWCLEKDRKDRLASISDARRMLGGEGEGADASVTALSPSRFGRLPWAAAAALVIGALGGWAIAHFRQPPADERAFRLQIDPPEGGQFVFGNSSGGIALSPDGRTAAYIASANGKTALWVRPLDAPSARPLAGTEGAYYPFWSPDGKSIGFFAAGKLQRLDLAGGAPLTSAMCQAVADEARLGRVTAASYWEHSRLGCSKSPHPAEHPHR